MLGCFERRLNGIAGLSVEVKEIEIFDLQTHACHYAP